MKIDAGLVVIYGIGAVVLLAVGALFFFSDRANKADEQACIAANGDVLRLRSSVVCLKKGSIIAPKK